MNEKHFGVPATDAGKARVEHSGCTVGLDLGDRWSRYCVLNPAGEVQAEGRVRTTSGEFDRLFVRMPCSRIVLETGTHSPWVSRQLQGLRHEVVVANARQVRLIYQSDRKNDRLDAHMLARLGRVDIQLLAPVRHRSAAAQADLAVVRGRDALVAARTQLINATRGMVKSIGGRLPKTSSSAWRRDSARTALRTGAVAEQHPTTDRTDSRV